MHDPCRKSQGIWGKKPHKTRTNGFWKIAEHKVMYLYKGTFIKEHAINKHMNTEMTTIILCTIAQKKIKYLDMTLKNAQELHAEQYEMLMKGMKEDLNKWRVMSPK